MVFDNITLYFLIKNCDINKGDKDIKMSFYTRELHSQIFGDTIKMW